MLKFSQSHYATRPFLDLDGVPLPPEEDCRFYPSICRTDSSDEEYLISTYTGKWIHLVPAGLPLTTRIRGQLSEAGKYSPSFVYATGHGLWWKATHGRWELDHNHDHLLFFQALEGPRELDSIAVKTILKELVNPPICWRPAEKFEYPTPEELALLINPPPAPAKPIDPAPIRQQSLLAHAQHAAATGEPIGEVWLKKVPFEEPTPEEHPATADELFHAAQKPLVAPIGTTDPSGKDAHEPGAKLDAGKIRLALVMSGFAPALTEVGRVGTYGANKYTPNGWKDVPQAMERYQDAMLRHMTAYWGGEKDDPESQLPHLAHAAWNALAILTFATKEVRK